MIREDLRGTKSLSFRKNIQGLRAIAVVLVLLFHFETVIKGGYLDIPRRIIAEIVTWFPIRQTGNVGSLIWRLMVSATAVFVAAMVKRVHPSKVLAIACVAGVVLASSASESQIGNQSVVKWLLILIAIVVVSLPEEHQLSARATVFLVLLSGVSNPMTFLAVAPFRVFLLQRKMDLKGSRIRRILILQFHHSAAHLRGICRAITASRMVMVSKALAFYSSSFTRRIFVVCCASDFGIHRCRDVHSAAF